MELNVKKSTLTAWNTSIAGWPKSPFCPFSPGMPCKTKQQKTTDNISIKHTKSEKHLQF